MTDGLKDAHREAIIAVIAANDRVERAVLFGSRATGTNTVTSDVDIALIGDQLTLTDRARLSAGIDQIPMAQTVDLLLYDSIRDQSLHDHIRNDGIEWFARPTRVATDSENWPTLRFKELLQGPVRNGIYKRKEYRGHGMKIVNMGELFAHPRLHAVPMKRVSLTESERDRFSVVEGDLLFARRSLVAEGAGRCCVVLCVDEPTTFESSIIRARPDPTRSDSLYLYYFFGSPLGLHLLDTIRRQVAVAGITGKDLAALTIPVPSPPQQRAIAQVLGTLDDKIELNRRMNETLEAMARALFKSWFVDFDPVRAKMEGRDTGLPQDIADLFPDRLVESELGEMPEGWEVKPLRDCMLLTMGQSPPGSTYNEDGDGLPFFQGRTDFGFRYPTNRRFCSAPTRIAGPEDTLVSVRAPVGDINVAWERCCIGRGVAALRHRSGSASYTYHSAWAMQRALREYQHTGTVFGAINKGQFEALRMVDADPKTVNVFDSLAGPLDARVRSSVAESRTLASLRDALLPKLISGTLRVPAVDLLLGRQ